MVFAPAASVNGGHSLRACTPSGGAASVELDLPAGWDESLTDSDLLREIQSASSQADD